MEPSLRHPVAEDLTVTRRNLPHWQAGGSTYFITFRIKGSKAARPNGTTAYQAPGGTGFQPALSFQERQVVKACILHWHRTKWHVHALTVMPDHAHVLATPLETSKGQWHSLSSILHSVKRQSAREINKLRGRRGSVWQDESFDRIVRDEKEFDEKAAYILGNSAKAGLAVDAWEYHGFWSEGMETIRPRCPALEKRGTAQEGRQRRGRTG